MQLNDFATKICEIVTKFSYLVAKLQFFRLFLALLLIFFLKRVVGLPGHFGSNYSAIYHFYLFQEE